METYEETCNLVGNDKYEYVEEIKACVYEDAYANSTVFAVLKKKNGKYDVIKQSYEDSCDEDYALSLGIEEVFESDIEEEERAIKRMSTEFDEYLKFIGYKSI